MPFAVFESRFLEKPPRWSNDSVADYRKRHTKTASGAIEDAQLLDRGLGAIGGGVAGGLTAGAAGAGIGQLVGKKADPAQVAKMMARSPTARKTGEKLLRWSIAGTPMQKRIAKLILSGKVKPAALVGLGIGLTGGAISGAVEGAKKKP